MFETENLSPELVERVLLKLGFTQPPTMDFTGLSDLYGAWCRKIPFDNIRKRIHLSDNDPRPLPGYDAAEFFQGWLQYGVGGTCWAGNGALHALLKTLGFSCGRGTATMLTDRQQPPNHGTVVVQWAGRRFLVDASMLHSTPLLLSRAEPSAIDHPAWGLRCSPQGGQWTIRWRPLHMPDGCDCRLEQFSVPRDTFRQLNEASRQRSIFNNSMYIRLNIGDHVIGISGKMGVYFTSSGAVARSLLTDEDRNKMLIEKMGISEEIIVRIPQDLQSG